MMIYIVYTMYILLPYIYTEYTWYIPTIYLIGVPDDVILAYSGWHGTVTSAES
jgi:hypothetical protein